MIHPPKKGESRIRSQGNPCDSSFMSDALSGDELVTVWGVGMGLTYNLTSNWYVGATAGYRRFGDIDVFNPAGTSFNLDGTEQISGSMIFGYAFPVGN